MTVKKKALGKGLAALIRDAGGALPNPAANEINANETSAGETKENASSSTKLPLGLLRRGRYQPRAHFDEGALQNLAESIKSSGVLQPILVRPVEDFYEIVAGERRFRAAQLAQERQIPVIIRKINDSEALQIGLIENLQREELNPIEEAKGFERLSAQFNHSHSEIGERVGKSRPYVVNSIRLLKLPAKVQQWIGEGKLSAGQGRALLSLDKQHNVEAIADEVLAKSLTVRQIEQYDSAQTPKSVLPETPYLSPDERAVIKRLSQKIGLKVDLQKSAKDESGKLIIGFSRVGQIEDLINKILKD